MSKFDTDSHGCGSAKVAACSCCQALAQVRQPGLDPGLISKLEALADAATVKTEKPKAFNSYISKVAAGATQKPDENVEQPAAKASKSAKKPLIPADHPFHKLWSGVSGRMVMSFGVVIPALMLSLFTAFCAKRLTLVLLNHPLETIAEVLLLLSIPYFNYQLWRALSTGKVKASLQKGVACGIALCSSVLMAFVSVASLFAGSNELASSIGTGFSTGFMVIAVLAVGAAVASAYIVFRFRKSLEFAQSKKSLAAYVSIGAILPLVILLASEVGPWSVRILERRAIAGNFEERKQSLDLLRFLNPERQLRMECGDARAAGLCGMFLPIKSSAQHELYFAITGKPYSFRSYANNDLSSMPDDYVSRHVVGDKVAGLSLVRSVLSGNVHANTLTSTMDWTFVLKNATAQSQEMRAEIGLPAGAVVTNATFWHSGEPTDLTTVPVDGDSQGYSNYNGGYMVSHLGHSRVLLQCQDVPQDEELKVRLTVVSPLKSEGKEASVLLPHLIASNFNHEGDQQLKLTANSDADCLAKNLKLIANAGTTMIQGNLTTEQLEGADPGICVDRSNTSTLPAVALDMAAVELAEEDAKAAADNQESSEGANNQVMVMIDGSSGVNAEQIAKLRSAMNKTSGEEQTVVQEVAPRYVTQSMVPSRAIAPNHLVVVLDGSVTMRSKLKEIKNSLRALSASSATLMIASQEQTAFSSAMPLNEALDKLKESDFVGGQDNLKAVVQGAELAGQSAGGAVLWIHGPQPVLNQEIYILTPFAAKPTFYELPVEIGPIDTYEFFKNHSEIGPFVQIASARVDNDKDNLSQRMNSLYKKWNPQNCELVSRLTETLTCPVARQQISGSEAKEIVVLRANQECMRLIAARQSKKASRIAVKYGIVTPVTCATAVVSRESSAGDATEIRGVNTAGTVRVNNLANLEALLNIVANLFEIIVAGAGLAIIVEALLVRESVGNVFGLRIPFAPGVRTGMGIAAIFLGLGVPGMINWFVASARDANLFS